MRPLKHVVDVSNLDQAIDTTQIFALVIGTDNPAPSTNPSNITSGNVVTHIEIEVAFGLDQGGFTDATSGNMCRLNWELFFNIGNAQTTPTPGLVGNNSLRNQVLHEDHHVFQPIAVNTSGAPVNYITYVPRFDHSHVNLSFNVPRSWQRFLNGDRLNLAYRYDWHGGAELIGQTKLKAVYKEIESE